MESGALVISLDFELYWGVRDRVELEAYKEHLLRTRKAISEMLETFNRYDIHVTWSTVGFLFFETKKELMDHLPDVLPEYHNQKFSPYHAYLEGKVGGNEKIDPFHFAPSIVTEIRSYPNQRIGTHTFSHYYCLEPGQDIHTFRADLETALGAAKSRGTIIESIIFPRNQYTDAYIHVCRELGIASYRGNEASWLYSPTSREEETLLRRAVRLTDAYVNLSGHNTYDWKDVLSEYPVNIPSSRFLRPYSTKLGSFDSVKLNRIKKGLTYAAENNRIYHLWWHPHNFGSHTEKNISNLKKILEHVNKLRDQYNFQSYNMEEVASKAMEGQRYGTS